MSNLIGISGKIGSGKDTVGKIIQYLHFCEKNPDVKKSYEEWINNPSDFEETSDYQIKKFADGLKDMVCLLIGCTRRDLESQEFKDSFLPKEWDVVKRNVEKQFEGDNESYTEFLRKETGAVISDKLHFFDVKSGLNVYTYLLKEERIRMTVRQLLQKLGTDACRDNLHKNVWVNALFADYKPKVRKEEITTSSGNKDYFRVHTPKNSVSNWIITDLRFPNEYKAVKDRGGITIRIHRDRPRESFHYSERALDDHSFDYVISNDGSINNLIDKVKVIYNCIKK